MLLTRAFPLYRQQDKQFAGPSLSGEANKDTKVA
jgi:hypothetical protein